MELVVLPNIALKTSRIGLGCARLVGGSTARESRKLIEQALALGIRYFDVAPSYGMGTAEELVGDVLGNSKDVVVATKVGPPRGTYSARANAIRKYLKPTLDRFQSVKGLLRKSLAKSPINQAPRPRYDFSRDRLLRSIDESCQLLRRDRIETFLLHEPHLDDLTPTLSNTLTELATAGRIGCWGVGIDARSAQWKPFGQVWQSGWQTQAAEIIPDTQLIFHGVTRYAPRNARGQPLEHPSTLLRRALAEVPSTIILVSAANPARLRNLLTAYDG
jgi:aryl-alcohol dehydrogenase-like predicted oxidoreductase